MRRKLIVELPGGSYRDATPDEVAGALIQEQTRRLLYTQLAAAQKAVESLAKNCPHKVTYDVPGYIYHERICMKCGHVSLL